MAPIRGDQFKERECEVLIKGVPHKIPENLKNIYHSLNEVLGVPNPPDDIAIRRLRNKMYRRNTILLKFPNREKKLCFFLNYRQYIKRGGGRQLKANAIGFNGWRSTKNKNNNNTENSVITIAEHLTVGNYRIYKKAKELMSSGIINEVVTHLGLVYYSNDVVTNLLVTNLKQFNVKFKKE